MAETKTIGFHDDLVTLSLNEYLAVHEENCYLRQRNLELQTALEAIQGITERVKIN